MKKIAEEPGGLALILSIITLIFSQFVQISRILKIVLVGGGLLFILFYCIVLVRYYVPKRNFKIILIVLAALIIFAFGNSLLSEELYGPNFKFSFEGNLYPVEPTYEVTQQIGWSKEDRAIGVNSVSVISDYRGSKYFGRLLVKIMRGESKIDEFEWDDFPDTREMIIDITPQQLFKYSNLKADNDFQLSIIDNDISTQEDSFDIVITELEREDALARRTIKVVHTPWMHSARLSDNVITEGESITVYIDVKNFGNAGDFTVQVNLFSALTNEIDKGEIIDFNPETLTQDKDGWWSQLSWELINSFSVDKNIILDSGEKHHSLRKISSSNFKANNIYLIESYLSKKLKYIEYPYKSWPDSSNDLDFTSDQHSYLTLIVLEP